MKRKALKGLVLTHLVVLALTFNIQTVRVETTTIVVPNDYSTIQEAIDAASSGDTIVVSEGFYSEGQIEVYKPLTLIAEGEVIVDGEWVYTPWDPGWAVFLVTSDNVTMRGFTVVNTWLGEAGILLYDVENGRLVNNCRIEHNKLQHHYFAVFAIGFENVVRENWFLLNGFDLLLGGYGANASGFNVVENNAFTGMVTVHGNSHDNILRSNSVKCDYGVGIYLSPGSHNNVIEASTLTGNLRGVQIVASYNNTVTGNVISHNEQHGIYLHGYLDMPSESNVITDNKILSNGYAGIYLKEGLHNTIERNMIRENQDGIYLESSDHNALETNIVIRSARYGIAVTTESDHNTIHKNKVLRNSEFDLYWDELGQGNLWKRNVYKTKSW